MANVGSGAGGESDATGITDAATGTAGATSPVTDAVVASLVERLRAGRCVLCAGARLGGGHDLRALVAALAAEVPELDGDDLRALVATRPLAAASLVRRRLGERFGDALTLHTTKVDVPEATHLFGALPFRAVVSAAFDDACERAFTRDGVAPKSYTPSDGDALKSDGKRRFVMRMLGDPARGDTVVFSEAELLARLRDVALRDLVPELYRSRSFLFVGFEARDVELSILLERVLAGARPHAGDDATHEVEHFAVLPGLSALEREELWESWRIHVLPDAAADELARTLQSALGDAPAALLPDDDDAESWLAILGDDVNHVVAKEKLDALARRLRQSGSWDALVELMLGRVAVEPAAEARAQMLHDVARVFEREVGDLGKAFTALAAAHKEDPRHQGATVDELARLAAATGMWSELAAELVEALPALPENDRHEAWLRLARLYRDHLSATDHAMSAVEQALALAASDAAIELRIELLSAAERWTELAAALGARGRHAEQAKILDERLSDGAAAATALRLALTAEPDRADVRAALEELLRRRAEWRELVVLLDGKAATLPPDEARVVAIEAAEICANALTDRKQAIARYEALATAEPRDLTILRALERLYADDGQHEQHLLCIGRQAEAVDSDRERAALYRRVASLWEEHPGGAPRAAEHLEKLLALDTRAEDALRSLERIYRSERKWPELVETYRRHAQMVPPPVAGEIFVQIGALYETELKQPEAAIDAYLDVETVLPNHGETLAALTRLYEKTAQWQKAADLLERRAQLAEVKAHKLELHHRAGEIYAAELGDARAAEARFVRALEIDPTHVASMTALVEIYRKHGEFLKAAKLLIEAVPYTPNRLERTRLLVEAGEIYDGLEDHKKAIELYLDALAVDPEHVEAGERVAELLWHKERYADLVPVLEMLTRKPGEATLTVARLLRLAHAAKALGADDKVAKAYLRAAELEPTSLPAQRGRAEVHLAQSAWQDARAALEAIAEHHLETLPPSERVELFHQRGVVADKLGNREEARQLFARALELDPAHRPSILASLQASIELGEARPESLIDAKKLLLVTASDDEKVKLHGEIGDLYHEKLADEALAIEAWREGLEIKPDDHKLLHKCLDLYVEAKAWPQALAMLERLIDNERNTSVRAKYRHAAGLICRDELGKPDAAAAHLSAALDDDGALDRSAEALEELYVERQAWKELARFYRKQLKRLGPDAADGKNDERLRVWSALADVCLAKLGERESAIAALEVALTFDRGNLDRHKLLADLYVQSGPEKFERSIVEHQHILKHEKNRVISYRALKHLYIQTAQRDKSTQVSCALAFLKMAEPDDLKKVAQHKALPFATARRTMTDELWARLAHPDEDRYLDALFALVGSVLALSVAQPHKTLGLVRKDALAADDPRSFAKAMKYVATTLGVNAPECYVRPEQKEAIAFANCADKHELVPVFVLGAPLVGDKRAEREQVFELARRVANLRPERLLRFIMPSPQQLGLVIDAAIAIGSEQDGGAPPTGELGKTAQSWKRALPPPAVEQIAALGRKLAALGTRGESAALAWLQASDLTAIRAGFALTGDLEASARIVAAEPQPATALPATQRLLELVWSSVTEDVFAVRKHLGVM
jgi:golgin subfamily B member 1